MFSCLYYFFSMAQLFLLDRFGMFEVIKVDIRLKKKVTAYCMQVVRYMFVKL